MADPSKNIESILAALAQQRPATTPNPNPVQMSHPNAPYQQAPTPNAYPPSMPPGVQAPPYAGGAYPLPQPSASGSFDFSAIKPVNSGTVSIADAIAQAKAFATEKGISYDHSRAPSASYQSHDPRAHYRSRSRSPPARRDAYRDNLNPYRDERRDEHRGTSREYGRDRSMSPGPSRGHFSPVATIAVTGVIESSLVGLIIGRQGENLRRVESETGCRVQFITGPDNQGPYRQCRISGPQARRAEAKAAIDRIIEDSGMGAIARAGLDKGRGGGAAAAHAPVPGTLREGEDCMQIMVPDRTVGLIIGRGGETIRDLQERSGCHINIVGENKSVNGLRPVNLIGSREAAAQAKEHIMEIVDSDSRNVNGGGKQDRPPRNDHGRDSGLPSMGGGMGGGSGGGMGGGGGGGGGDKINDSIYVPSEAVGMIIGKGGETIREMQSQTGCKINVSQSSGPGEVEREIGLVGSREAIGQAKLAIEDKVEAVRQKNSGGGGRGGGRGPRRDYDNPNYSQSGSNSGSGPSGAPAGQPPAAANGADPYAAYGGYQAYLALWYQALAQQQQNGQGDAPKP
ncbi:hypothetical protein PG994_002162 [Apiospora phragmitis]|uniref:K Homology domain-containing protein n=1 Tax=Apiospora phragmitis TaxID=2905665 RepID=A0ABR1WVJ0_9PEZI